MRLPVLLISAIIPVFAASAQQTAPSVKIVNGLWFDGARFTPRTVYMSHGFFTSKPAREPDSVIDAHGGYVVPPFAEAHNHNIDANSPAAAKTLVAKYMKDGVFYGQNPSNVLRARTGLAGYINVPQGLDATFSNAGLTGPGGHPIGLFLRNLGRGVMLATDSNTTEGFVWTIRDRADLDRKWPLVLASKPDFIKVLMLYSDQYEKRLHDTTYFNWRGIDPKLVVEIAKRAHARGLRVMAHVETAADFRNALTARVDEIGHTPGFRGNEKTQLPDLTPYELTDADAERAARQGAYVVTTLGGIVGVPDTALRRRADSLFARNLRVMKKHHVKVIVGSDSYRTTSLPEALYLSTLGVYTNAELLRLWTEDTPRAIFPNRKIGKLATGYESSFLVLDKNPLSDFANVQTIRLRVKQGFTIQ